MTRIAPRLCSISPIVPVTDLARSIAFFTDVLGFTLGFRADNHAYLSRDAIAIRLVGAAPGTDLSDPRRQQACYIDVEGIDALYASMRTALDKLPPGRVRAPFDQDYGMREFHVIDEDALLIFFGEPVGCDEGSTS